MYNNSCMDWMLFLTSKQAKARGWTSEVAVHLDIESMERTSFGENKEVE